MEKIHRRFHVGRWRRHIRKRTGIQTELMRKTCTWNGWNHQAKEHIVFQTFIIVLHIPWKSKTKQRMALRMIDIKDSLLPMGKVWSIWTPWVFIVRGITNGWMPDSFSCCPFLLRPSFDRCDWRHGGDLRLCWGHLTNEKHGATA